MMTGGFSRRSVLSFPLPYQTGQMLQYAHEHPYLAVVIGKYYSWEHDSRSSYYLARYSWTRSVMQRTYGARSPHNSSHDSQKRLILNEIHGGIRRIGNGDRMPHSKADTHLQDPAVRERSSRGIGMSSRERSQRIRIRLVRTNHADRASLPSFQWSCDPHRLLARPDSYVHRCA
jgi:hypothetical protein